ncbi:potassium-transporting ATPase subunit KdpA [Alistipes sp. ZOR0009]|jgi:K+-transporting ATPase ATPase A chain|uniref:potassium-transporting ATPase subunit KdpA n=1 Tax=Alistipes sp. ZOR0009 TaxID=1339253 RepID=UPI000648FC39|nr:potassium-transporting ATPase subunit KdpA [Alistipes sp. ZOR0009]
MTTADFIQIAIYVGLLVALAPLLGKYMARVFTGKKHFMLPALGWLERLCYRTIGVDSNKEQDWKSYLWALLLFNLFGFIFLFVLLMCQGFLPLNPQHLPGLDPFLAFNTTASFVTNTNWQSYGGENTLSYLSQMLGLGVQNFVSAATGFTVILALIRGLSRKSTTLLGNFWVDLTRSTLYVLLPLAIILSVALVSEGTIQNFNSYTEVHTLQGATQVIPQGPAASQIAIKQLGSNGGGFFNTNSSHPFENPTPFTNLLEMLSLLLLAAALPFTYGKMVGNIKQGRIIFGVMLVLFLAGLSLSMYSEYSAHAAHAAMMEGKETRLGLTNSILWSVSTTCASNGAVNAMHDSLSPLSGMVSMVNMMLGEVIFGGVGAGLYGILIFVFLTVFIAGLMVGRTPEYLGKKIDAYDIKMSMVAVLAPNFVVLVFSAIAVMLPSALTSLNNAGPHGFSEILYAFTSAAGNNGSAFAGLNANTPFYNTMIGLGMLIGRFGIIVPVMAIAGNLAQKKITPPSAGTFRTDNMLFAGLLITVILIVGGLTFFPALSLGPIVEHLLMNAGVTF